MTIEEIKTKIASKEYDFLITNEHLGDNIILLCLGGSHAYGTDTPQSDLDVRGIALNSRHDILTGHDFEQSINNATDTTIYSFDKIIRLLSQANPNVIECLGLKPEHYLQKSPYFEYIFSQKTLFLSKQCIHTFVGYANTQLRRMENKASRIATQEQNESNILKSIENASFDFKKRYLEMPNDAIKLYIDKAVNEDYDFEIFMDVNLTHYPLRDYKSMWSDMQSIVKSYAKAGYRNGSAIEHGKLGKHMMHLIRLYLMCLDILKDGKIITYREKEHDFLMDIRNGKYLDENNQPMKSFYDIVDEYESQLDYWKVHTDLPEHPDMEKIWKMVEKINGEVVKGENHGKNY